MMKPLLRRTTVLFAALLLAGASDAFAQRQADAGATSSIEVLAALKLTNKAPINFGQVNNTAATITLDETSGSVSTDGAGSTAGTPSVGKFIAEGQNDTQITVSYGNATLTNQSDNSTTLTFTPTVKGSGTDHGSNTGGNANSVSNNTSVSLNDSDASDPGKYFFWVGGIVGISQGQAQGTYSGTFTLEVEYTNL